MDSAWIGMRGMQFSATTSSSDAKSSALSRCLRIVSFEPQRRDLFLACVVP